MESYLKINTKQIIDNYKIIHSKYQKNIIAVIKDNAYGHGLIQVGKALSSVNCFMLAVSSINEAILLRKNLIFLPIFLFGRCDDYKLLYSLKITISITSLEQLKILSKSELPISIHLKIETGMNRLGLLINELDEAKEIIKKSKLNLKGIFTHFCSENYHQQLTIFNEGLKKFDNLNKLCIHTQASSYINENITNCNTLRVGLALYGYSNYLDVKPALKLFCPIIRKTFIKQNTSIGYDLTESTTEDGYILTIPFGYSHGLSRLKKICFTYQNETYYQIGKSCMDLTMIFINKDLDIKEISLIDEVNTFNLLTYNNESIYYLLSSLSPNIKRIY